MTPTDPLLLALDTATGRATVALCRGGVPLVEEHCRPTTHSEGLMPMVARVLERGGVQPTELDAVVCGRGPGSFTGLRIGMATAKGLCFAAECPLICVSSLQALALGAAQREGGEPWVLALIDARRGEVYSGLFRGEAPRGEERVGPPAEVDLALPAGERLLLAGDGALAHREQLLAALGPGATLAAEECHVIEARHLAREGARRLAAGELDDLAAAVPRYIRASDARLPATPQNRRDAAEPDPEWVERLRHSDLRLDREGRWWHEGSAVEHPRLLAALHRWLDRLDDGRYVVRLDSERFAYVEVEDAPYLVRTLRFAPDDRVWLKLSDDSEEMLDGAGLAVASDDVLYCRVKGGRFEARFSRQAYYLLAERVEPQGSGFAMRLGGRLWPIGRRGATAGH